MKAKLLPHFLALWFYSPSEACWLCVKPVFLWRDNGWAQESVLGHGLGHGNDQG